MRECSIGPDRTVMIGDTTYDIEMAFAAEVAGLGVAWGYHPHEMLVEAGADEIVSEYALLAEAVERLLQTKGEVT
jgi:phosphoglycolate phosphatase